MEEITKPLINKIANKLGIDKKTLTNSIILGFLVSYEDIEHLLIQTLKHAKKKDDALWSVIATALYLYAQQYEQKAINLILDALKCRGRYIPAEINYDLEDSGRYELYFIPIMGTQYIIDNFKIIKYNEDEYDLITTSFIPRDINPEQVIQYIEKHLEKLQDKLKEEFTYEIEEYDKDKALQLTFFAEFIDEFPTIPQISKTIETILENTKNRVP